VLVENHRKPRREAERIRAISGIGHRRSLHRLSVVSPGASHQRRLGALSWCARGLKINLVMALVLVAIGGAGLVYFYFIAETWSTWLATAAGMVGFAGLYWLWDEHVNAGPPSQR
jgi:hypothetical protein